MKLVICDDKGAKYFSLPKNPEKFYMINFDFCTDFLVFNEVLTLKNEKNTWTIIADDKLSIKQNGANTKTITLKEYETFELKFADMSNFFQVFVMPDICDYLRYSIYNIDRIDIGSDKNCAIEFSGLFNVSATLIKSGYDYYIQRIDPRLSSSFVNKSSYNVKKLSLGDIIFINGITIIYMKSFIMINFFKQDVNIKGLPVVEAQKSGISTPITPVTDIEKNVKLYTEDQLFVHTPRLKREIEEIKITFDEPPEKEENKRMPAILTFGSTALMSVTSASTLLSAVRNYHNGTSNFITFVFEVIGFGAILVGSLFIPILTRRWEKHMERKNEKLRQKKYKKYITEKEEEIKNIVVEQEEILKENNLPLEKILENIANNGVDVWNREIYDNDFLDINMGYGNIPANIKVEPYKEHFSLHNDNLKDLIKEVSNKEYELESVPISFSIYDNIALPIVLNCNYADDYIKAVMIQLLYFYSGADLKIVTITNKYNEQKWNFMKYVPHSWDDTFENRFFASSENDVTQISMYLEQEFEARNKENENAGTSESSEGKTTVKQNVFAKNYLIVTDDFKMARELSIVNKILESDKNMGFYLLIFEKSMKDLPSRVNKMIQITDDNGLIVEKNTIKKDNRISFKPMYIPNFDIEPYANIISNIPLTIRSANYDIPSSLSFLDMFQAGRVEQLNILSRWNNNNPTISLKTPIGMKDNNRIVDLDLHEKYHGPHGLIAGSTGSGKSEFIITFILSLAVNYHPYEVQFVLIDYKGGGLAGAFENRETGIRIPHLVGTITNLDKSEMNRTLVSIKSELQRRQKVFNQAREKLDEGTIDIYKYQRLYREKKVDEPMAHLFIISDEFAELKAQQPDFMDELVSTARIGRSLGVHLILATQKPSGVVNDQIWSNTRFRVCLKVQTTDDSNELLKKPDAANIKESGRFYLQVGNDEIYELAQSGWAGAKYVPSDNVQRKIDDNILVIANNGDVIKTITEEVKKDTEVDMGEQLTNIVKYLYNLAITQKIKFSKLWLDNVPEVLLYNNVIKKYDIKPEPYNISPVIGEYDDPANQKQGYVRLPFADTGNTYIVGSTGSGKSTLLSTMIYSMITNHSTNEVNIYIIDLGTEKLKVFQNAPQVGDVLTSADPDKIKFLFHMLKSEKEKRFGYYSEKGGDYYKDIKNKKCPFPNIVVIINQFDVFRENFESIFDEDFVPFTRNCTKVGITFVITSTVTNSIGFMAENNFPTKIMLNMVNQDDYLAFFDKPPIPKKNAGRGIVKLDTTYEFQVPLIFDEDQYDKNLNYVIIQLDKFIDKKARRVPVVPDEVDINSLIKNVDTIKNVPIGINIQTAQVETCDFSNTLNIATSENHNAVKNFITQLSTVVSKIKDTKVMIVNSLKELEFSDLDESIKYYDSNLKSVVGIINDNVNKYKEKGGDTNFLLIFVGYADFQNHLSKEKKEDGNIVTIDDLILNSKNIDNFKYLIYDSEQGIQRLESGKLDNLFKKNNGIWLGKNFDTQSTFDGQMSYSTSSLTANNVVLIKNGKVSYIKYM